jgi:sulfite reductase beta subunit-like hemoprotein
MPSRTWKQEAAHRAHEPSFREIEIFETQFELRRRGKIDEKLFAETRLRRGVYGQRYDNGQRHDGERTQKLEYPCGDLTKGPNTVWDAPGMMRIKIPYGKLSAEQLETLAAISEEYSDQILHVTTRQDIQLHFVHIDDTPDLMRRLALVGITTREACGNSVRNVTACPLSGVCQTETFDVTPYANAITYFLLGHDDTQGFGRKFKVAFSGCKHNACGLTNFHDLGCIARTRDVDGRVERGFETYVGGGLGAVPYPAQLLAEFLPEAELLPTAQAVARIFARLGEKQNRSRARLKFVVKKLGIEEFSRLVREERQTLRPDPRWTAFLDNLHDKDEQPLRPGAPLLADAGLRSAAFEAWRASNVRPQKQPGYVTARVTLPLGDFTPVQARALVDLMHGFTGDTLRTTVDQNLLFRWVSEADLPELFAGLDAVGLGAPGAESISDVVACPGTDTCKLGISSSRGLAGELRRRLLETPAPEAARDLHIKCSGCFNSCGQHHVADIGFLGVSRNVNGRRVPHFQLVVGGQWSENGGSYGLAIGAVPSSRVPELTEKLTTRYATERKEGEGFRAFIDRIGKREVRKLVDAHAKLPSYEEDPSHYSDWGDPREYSIGDIGVGECAGEVVSLVEIGLAAAERELFEAQLLLESNDATGVARGARATMLQAARALTREKSPNLSEDPEEIVSEFRRHYYDTQVFFDPFVGGKFAHFFFRAHETRDEPQTLDSAHQLLEEAQLFLDAAHQCYVREGARLATPTVSDDATEEALTD